MTDVKPGCIQPCLERPLLALASLLTFLARHADRLRRRRGGDVEVSA